MGSRVGKSWSLTSAPITATGAAWSSSVGLKNRPSTMSRLSMESTLAV